jgi:hypothetical protein
MYRIRFWLDKLKVDEEFALVLDLSRRNFSDSVTLSENLPTIL